MTAKKERIHMILKWLLIKQKGLNKWEKEFCISIEQQFRETNDLTETQIDKLEEIYKNHA